MPCSMARRAAPSADSAAAYGVLLREPLNPAVPAEPQLTTAPFRSVIVMSVLLNVAWICTCPWGTFFFSRRRCLVAFFRSAMPLRQPLLLATHADGLLRTAALASICLRSLAADREVAPVAQPAVRADLDQSLDIQRNFAAQVALDLVAPVDELAQAVHLLFG